MNQAKAHGKDIVNVHLSLKKFFLVVKFMEYNIVNSRQKDGNGNQKLYPDSRNLNNTQGG